MSDPVEGVDYLFNRYAFLDVAEPLDVLLRDPQYRAMARAALKLEHSDLEQPAAEYTEEALTAAITSRHRAAVKEQIVVSLKQGESGLSPHEVTEDDITQAMIALKEDEIIAAIKQKKSENHPDRYRNTGEEARNIAKRLWELTEQCEEILTDRTKREAFDAQLVRFREEMPEVICDDGTPMLSLKRTRVSLEGLLGEMPSTEHQEKLTDSLVGFSPRQITIMEGAYRANPDDEETREAYRDVLVNGMLHYDLSQDVVWTQAGVQIGSDERNTMRLFLEEVSEGVQAQIKRIGDSIEARVQEHVALIGSGLAKPLLLTDRSGGAGAGSNLPAQATADPQEIVEAARANFKQRTHRLTQLAAKHQEMMGKLLDTMEIWQIGEELPKNGRQCICLMQKEADGEFRCMIGLVIDFDHGGALATDAGVRGLTIDELRARPAEIPMVAMETHSEIRDYPVYATYLNAKLNRDNTPQAAR